MDLFHTNSGSEVRAVRHPGQCNHFKVAERAADGAASDRTARHYQGIAAASAVEHGAGQLRIDHVDRVGAAATRQILTVRAEGEGIRTIGKLIGLYRRRASDSTGIAQGHGIAAARTAQQSVLRNRHGGVDVVSEGHGFNRSQAECGDVGGGGVDHQAVVTRRQRQCAAERGQAAGMHHVVARTARHVLRAGTQREAVRAIRELIILDLRCAAGGAGIGQAHGIVAGRAGD